VVQALLPFPVSAPFWSPGLALFQALPSPLFLALLPALFQSLLRPLVLALFSVLAQALFRALFQRPYSSPFMAPFPVPLLTLFQPLFLAQVLALFLTPFLPKAHLAHSTLQQQPLPVMQQPTRLRPQRADDQQPFLAQTLRPDSH